jgi:ribosome-binding protein aMBF1 (putative translation factor)
VIRLTVERDARGWSRSELARRAWMNAATVGQIESGRVRPYDSQVEKLARALGWPSDRAAELLDEVRDRDGE